MRKETSAAGGRLRRRSSLGGDQRAKISFLSTARYQAWGKYPTGTTLPVAGGVRSGRLGDRRYGGRRLRRPAGSRSGARRSRPGRVSAGTAEASLRASRSLSAERAGSGGAESRAARGSTGSRPGAGIATRDTAAAAPGATTGAGIGTSGGRGGAARPGAGAARAASAATGTAGSLPRRRSRLQVGHQPHRAGRPAGGAGAAGSPRAAGTRR